MTIDHPIDSYRPRQDSEEDDATGRALAGVVGGRLRWLPPARANGAWATHKSTTALFSLSLRSRVTVSPDVTPSSSVGLAQRSLNGCRNSLRSLKSPQSR